MKNLTFINASINTFFRSGPMKSLHALVAMVVIVGIATVSQAASLVFNGNFDANPQADGALRAFVPGTGAGQDGWTPTGANIFLYDPDVNRVADQGGVNNTAYLPTTTSLQQTLAITLTNSTRYTLAMDMSNNSAFGGGIFFFPTLGDGVSTGNVFARLLANGGAMPGFVSSTVSVPPIGGTTTWTLVWQTGPSEPLFGDSLSIDLSVGSADGATAVEAFFDNVSLTTPEPTSLSLLAVGSLLALRRTRRARA